MPGRDEAEPLQVLPVEQENRRHSFHLRVRNTGHSWLSRLHYRREFFPLFFFIFFILIFCVPLFLYVPQIITSVLYRWPARKSIMFVKIDSVYSVSLLRLFLFCLANTNYLRRVNGIFVAREEAMISENSKRGLENLCIGRALVKEITLRSIHLVLWRAG